MIRIGNVAGHHLTRSGDIDGGCDVHGFHEFTKTGAATPAMHVLAASEHFIRMVPPRLIVFTWGWEGNGIPSRRDPRLSRSSWSQQTAAP